MDTSSPVPSGPTTATSTDGPSQPATIPSATRPRVWPAVVLVVGFWSLLTLILTRDLAISTAFVSMFGSAALLGLLFLVWWMTNRRIAWSDRLFGLAVVGVGGILATVLCDPSVGMIGIMLAGVPLVITAWLVWLLVARGRPSRQWRLGMLGMAAVIWGSMTVVRSDGTDGSNRTTISWRWSESAEDRYLAERSQSRTAAPRPEVAAGAAEPLAAQDGDWLEFRGPDRRGEVHGVTISTNWNDSPPRELWRRKIGPAWSSVLIVGDRLFTQEQRGDHEVVVCLDAATGGELWEHKDETRFSDGQAGAGPRATPTFVAGRIYSMGASGVVDCLDAATGKLHWTRNVVNDTAAPIPMWGFSSSPLVADGIVSVYAGGPGDKGMVAYDAETGEPAWSVATGAISYSSPQLVTIDGVSQVLLFSDQGVVAVDPKKGTLRWEFVAPGAGIWRVVQPRQLDDGSVLVGCEDLGLVRLDATRGDQGWTVEKRWDSRAMRPAYNDLVTSEGHIYGFDEAIFTCVDLDSGKRRWKAGRYGHGQVLLVADQKLLVIISETGEAVLVSARPDKHEELGRFQAVTGKTWNHPVIAHGRLYVRNDTEIACFDVAPGEAAR